MFKKQKTAAAAVLAGFALTFTACGGGGNGGSAPAGPGAGGPSLSTASVDRGDVTRVINASGKIVPKDEVMVGAEVSGRIVDVLVDFNSEVEVGQILARINPETFQNSVTQLESRLNSAQSDLLVQEASLQRARVSLEQANLNLNRRQSLFEQNAVSEAQLEQAQSQAGIAEADLALAEARLESAKASIREVRAQLNTARANLDKTIIRSPIDGIVVDRKIDPGQTVQASFSAPELFIIAADLSEVRVEARIVESDVGGLDPGDKVKFTVDAYPDMTLEGTVEQLRLQAAENNNIVSYTAVIAARNDTGQLLPGMTANLEITTDVKPGVLRLPTAAERFRPSPQQIASFQAETSGSAPERTLNDPVYDRLETIGVSDAKISDVRDAMEEASAPLLEVINDPEQSWRHTPMKVRLAELQDNILRQNLATEDLSAYNALVASQKSIREAEVWRQVGDGKMEKVNVRLGVSDGAFTEVVSGLDDGDQLVTGVGGGGPQGRGRP